MVFIAIFKPNIFRQLTNILTCNRLLLNRLWAVLCAWAIAVVGLSCNNKHKSIGEIVFEAQKNAFIDKYAKIPREEIILQSSNTRVYSEMKEYYKRALIELKAATDKDCAKLIVVVLTIETGKYATAANVYGIPYIVVTADNMGLDFYNLADSFTERDDIPALTQTTEEGVWSKQGAAYVAGMLGDILMKYDTVRSSHHLYNLERPATFGDLQPNQDEQMYDYGDVPYRLKVNSQGLRMDHDIKFPKTKQTILFLGDAQVFNPMLDNKDIITGVLQRRFPGKEIINAGVSNYSMDDFASLYKDKARFTEPDIVVLVTNGGDILEQFFSYRNKYSRLNRIYEPSDAEAQFYEQLYGKPK